MIIRQSKLPKNTDNIIYQGKSACQLMIMLQIKEVAMAEDNKGCGWFLIILIILGFIAGVYLKWTPLSRHKFTRNKVEFFPVLPIYYPSPLS
jgi:hypothetical protein